MFNRIRMDQMEVNIMRGFLTAINKLGKPQRD
jgi:tRNA C32,U32 (ribose-2'-O)-methylase TrmJ